MRRPARAVRAGVATRRDAQVGQPAAGAPAGLVSLSVTADISCAGLRVFFYRPRLRLLPLGYGNGTQR
jgi:hypothetical protein